MMQQHVENLSQYSPNAPERRLPGALLPEVGQMPDRPSMASLSQSGHVTMFDTRQPRTQARLVYFRDTDGSADLHYSWQPAYMKAVTDLTEQVRHIESLVENLLSRVGAVEDRAVVLLLIHPVRLQLTSSDAYPPVLSGLQARNAQSAQSRF